VSAFTSTGGRGLRDRLLDEAESLELGNPETFWRVASLCRDPRADSRDVALEIQRDEGFAASVLRLANSAYFASSSRIGDLPTAVARLGFEVVEGLAVSIQGARLAGSVRDGLSPFRRELHRHAIRTGLAARMIGAADIDHEQALAAGLVHNLGLTVVSLLRPDVFRKLLDAAEAGQQLQESEEELLDFTHAELGGLLAERWRYPLPLVMAIVDHDNPEASGLPALVQVADHLAREAGVGVEAPVEIAPEVASRAGVDLERARARLAPLFQAAARSEGAEDGSASQPTTREGRLAAALDEIA
jgi:HD-like signal output (HDOD) protein